MTLIEHDDNKHLYPAFVQFAAECRTYLSVHQGDRDAILLLAKADSLIARADRAWEAANIRRRTKGRQDRENEG